MESYSKEIPKNYGKRKVDLSNCRPNNQKKLIQFQESPLQILQNERKHFNIRHLFGRARECCSNHPHNNIATEYDKGVETERIVYESDEGQWRELR